jgi:hypothetical protein
VGEVHDGLDALVDQRLEVVIDVDAGDQLEVTLGPGGLLDRGAHFAPDLSQRAQHAHLECTHGANLALAGCCRPSPVPMSPGGSGGLFPWIAQHQPREEEPRMKTTVVRYRAKPDRADENQTLIEAVFAELEERQPEGFTYKVFRLEDAVSFIHVVIEHDVDQPDSLQDVTAFRAFVADIAERCDVPPVASAATIVGGYR